MSPRKHPWGCTCRTHVDRPWDRSEHWSAAEVNLLDRQYGRRTDEAIARSLGRTPVAVLLKAKRLGLHKRQAGFTARAVAQIFGVDATTVTKQWMPRDLLSTNRVGRGHEPNHSPSRARMRPGTMVDRYRRPAYWIIEIGAVERMIREHPEYVDVDKMPPSWYRDLAARDPWISLPEVHRRTGRSPHIVARMIRAGDVRGRRRGSHWYMPVADLPKVGMLRSLDAIEDSVFRRASVLEMRRNRRKGSVPRLGSGRSTLSIVQRVAS